MLLITQIVMTVRFGRKKTRQNVIVISKYALEEFVICSINEHPDYLSPSLGPINHSRDSLTFFVHRLQLYGTPQNDMEKAKAYGRKNFWPQTIGGPGINKQ